MKDCEVIETARAEALRAAGYTPSTPLLQIYDTKENNGMHHTHSYAIAAASIIDQIDKGLAAGTYDPIRNALESTIADTCYRLGCREISPIDWHPSHITEDQINEDNIIEAGILARIRSHKATAHTGDRFPNALDADKWYISPEARNALGPYIWEQNKGECGKMQRDAHTPRD